jgi:hypothetical protein
MNWTQEKIKELDAKLNEIIDPRLLKFQEEKLDQILDDQMYKQHLISNGIDPKILTEEFDPSKIFKKTKRKLKNLEKSTHDL